MSDDVNNIRIVQVAVGMDLLTNWSLITAIVVPVSKICNLQKPIHLGRQHEKLLLCHQLAFDLFRVLSISRQQVHSNDGFHQFPMTT